MMELPVFELPEGSPRVRGRAHGEAFREKIHQLAQLRTDLALSQGRFPSEGSVLETARRHLPVLEGWDSSLYEELLGIAEGADIPPERVVVLNHYTDLKDIDPARPLADFGPEEEDCSAVVALTEGDGPVLGQTWDMHGSAAPFVLLLDVPALEVGPLRRPPCQVFTLVGCVGMTGLNAHGLGITINNLKSHDARIGVLWPALVRRMLAQPTVPAARHVLQTAPLSSGHHYLLASPEATCAIETSGVVREVVFEADFAEAALGTTFVHTNHCLAEATARVSWVNDTSTTHRRFDWLTQSLGARPVAGAADLWVRLGSHDGYPKSVCTHLSDEGFGEHAMKTCGGVVMRLRRRELWATAGCLHEATPVVRNVA
jgi:isopenicillin-N N-acyltransferase-like protein